MGSSLHQLKCSSDVPLAIRYLFRSSKDAGIQMQRDSPTWRTEGKTLPGPTASFCWGAARNVQDHLGNSLCRPEACLTPHTCSWREAFQEWGCRASKTSAVDEALPLVPSPLSVLLLQKCHNGPFLWINLCRGLKNILLCRHTSQKMDLPAMLLN